MMAINVRGTWLTIRAIGPLMRKGGSIVTLSSDTIYWGPPKLLHYVTSKSAIVGMTRSLARELGERMIRVNCLLPGLTMGEATKDIPQARWNDYAERTILKRIQQPDDLDGVGRVPDVGRRQVHHRADARRRRRLLDALSRSGALHEDRNQRRRHRRSGGGDRAAQGRARGRGLRAGARLRPRRRRHQPDAQRGARAQEPRRVRGAARRPRHGRRIASAARGTPARKPRGSKWRMRPSRNTARRSSPSIAPIC